jgi:hypothetical protein
MNTSDTDFEVKLGKDNLPYLSEICRQLWCGHASVLVGSCFSRSATPNSQSCGGFPDWNELGNLFYDKIYGMLPAADKPDKSYLKVLKLAQEVETAFGRPVLNQLLKQAVPDTGYEPSDLHKKLLQLPWTDVFTTNYDTLLERATSLVIERRYDSVVNKEDLIYSRHPRIIKLHGSFPSTFPFIITEEDYRRYPSDFAPFVNTVRQSMLENTLCLIGFSGNDPDFLYWLSWIRDNSGSTSLSKIYLVGLFNFTDAQKKLLEQKNCIIVNLPAVSGTSPDPYYAALDLFFRYLLQRGKTMTAIQWPYILSTFYPDSKKTKTDVLQQIIPVWKEQRQTYPGWVIVPESKRQALFEGTGQWIDFIPADADIPDDLLYEYVSELVWRLEKSLYPLQPSTAKLIENVIQRREQEKNFRVDAPYLELKLSLLGYYRQNGKTDEWTVLTDSLEQQVPYCPLRFGVEFHYEKALGALFQIDIPRLRKELAAWDLNDSLQCYNCKKAVLMAETGDIEQAEQIIRRSIELNRRQQNLSPLSVDLTLQSEESYMIFLHETVLSLPVFSVREQLSGNKEAELREKNTERLTELKAYLCDPWNEIQYFELSLKKQYIPFRQAEEKFNFDLGSGVTRHLETGDTGQILAGSFLMFSETAGIPYRIHVGRYFAMNISTASAAAAVLRLADYNLFWCISVCLQIADKDLVGQFFTRKAVAKLPVAYIDALCERLINALHENADNIRKGSDNNLLSDFEQVLAGSIPEILSRFCCKCSVIEKKQLLEYLAKLYGASCRYRFTSLKQFTRRLVESFSDSEQAEILVSLLRFPIPSTVYWQEQDELTAPCSWIKPERVKRFINNREELSQSRLLEPYYEAAQSKEPIIREWGIRTLFSLFLLGVLAADQQNRLAEVAWNETDANGFPFGGYYCFFSYLNLPHPLSVNPEALFKKYIVDENLPVFTHERAWTIRGEDPGVKFCDELREASSLSAGRPVWTSDEFTILIHKLQGWWNADKDLLIQKKDEHVKNTVTNRFQKMEQALSALLENYNDAVTDSTSAIAKQFLTDFERYRIPHAELLAVCAGTELTEKIRENMASGEDASVVDGLRAIVVVLKRIASDNGHRSELSAAVLTDLGLLLLYRKESGLSGALPLCIRIVDEFDWAFTGEFEENVLLSLRFLEADTDSADDPAGYEPEEKILIRMYAAGLANRVYTLYKKNGKKIPEVITRWQTICGSENEFAEVRNAWET